MVDREDDERGVELVVLEGERVGGGVDRARQRRVAPRPHLGGGLDRGHLAVARLVGAGPGADVQHRAGAAEGGDELRPDPRIGAPDVRVVDGERRVVGVVPIRHPRAGTLPVGPYIEPPLEPAYPFARVGKV